VNKPNPIIAIHGGAGAIARSEMTAEQERDYLEALHAIVCAGQKLLAEGASALDTVTETVRLFEDCPLFNAGKGAVFTAAGTHELDASLMDGKTLAAGAVACVRRLPNPVLAARAVMEHSGHVLLAGEAAEAFAQALGLPLVEPEYFYTEFRYAQWQLARGGSSTLLDHDASGMAARRTDSTRTLSALDSGKYGTVGAVALDAEGNLAAATSTGGMTNKRAGRVGDSPIIGAGCYANNRTVAVSGTGMGEMFIRAVVAYDVSAQMEYGGKTLQQAVEHVVFERLPRIAGRGGLIAVDHFGNVAMRFNTEGMYRGFARVGQTPETAIYGSE
jgi:beta-aspartyl-peptidase (threonine type)